MQLELDAVSTDHFLPIAADKFCRATRAIVQRAGVLWVLCRSALAESGVLQNEILIYAGFRGEVERNLGHPNLKVCECIANRFEVGPEDACAITSNDRHSERLEVPMRPPILNGNFCTGLEVFERADAAVINLLTLWTGLKISPDLEARDGWDLALPGKPIAGNHEADSVESDHAERWFNVRWWLVLVGRANHSEIKPERDVPWEVHI